MTATRTQYTSSKALKVGMNVLIIAKGQVLGGGDIIAINGRTITVAQLTEVNAGDDHNYETTEELALDEYTIGRSITAWAK